MTSDTDDPVAATSVRNMTLADLAGLLREQQARKVDIVAPATAIRSRGGQLVIDGTDPQFAADGITMTAGTYTPTEVCDQGLADKLGIPAAYLRRLREQRPGLYDANVNGWLDADPRKFLIRCLRPALGTGPGAARAFLSDGYRRIDNLDVLLAALDGVRAAGVPVEIDGCDLTERRMYVRVVCEQVAALAPALLADYRSPFTGASGADNPVVFAGFVISNSETGCGAFTLTPRLVVQVCRNGMTITKDAIRAVHLGERLDEGVVTWSGNTLDKTLALITARTTDAVATFLDPRYADRVVRDDHRPGRAPGGGPAGGGGDGERAAAVHRRPAGRHPGPLHPGRRPDRGRDLARGDQRRPGPARRRHRARHGGGRAARPGDRRRPLNHASLERPGTQHAGAGPLLIS